MLENLWGTMKENGLSQNMGTDFSFNQRAPEALTFSLLVKIRTKCSWYYLRLQEITLIHKKKIPRVSLVKTIKVQIIYGHCMSQAK